MSLFGEPRVEGEERERCLAYLDEMSKLSWFLNHESEQFTYTWDMYITTIAANPAGASQLHLGRKAASRLLQAAREAIRRHEELKPVPDAALPLYAADSLFLLRTKEWAEGTVVAAEDLANGLTPETVEPLARGLLPHQEYLEHLIQQHQSAWREVGQENKRFLKRLRLTASEKFEISFRDDMNRSAASCVGCWQPEPYTGASSDAGTDSQTTSAFESPITSP